jgi:hypothetical protein
LLHQVIDANDPDLSAFRQHGGKLIMYFGWADPQLNPRVAVEYYDQVVERMRASTGDVFRLFMVPGMFHCGGGVGTSIFDVATPLLHWVESGDAPKTIAASRISNGDVTRTPAGARSRSTGAEEAPRRSGILRCRTTEVRCVVNAAAGPGAP